MFILVGIWQQKLEICGSTLSFHQGLDLLVFREQCVFPD